LSDDLSSTMSSTVIKNAKVFHRRDILACDVLIERGKIEKIGRVEAAEQEIDAHGQLLLPGAIDAHVHFRDLGEAYKEDWYSGSCAAAAGGVTTVIDQPNTRPTTSNVYAYFAKQRAARKSIVDYGINAAIDRPDQLEALWRLGVTAFGEAFIQQTPRDELVRALQIIKRLGALLCVHAETNPRQAATEAAGIRTVLDCNQTLGAKIHISHLSTAAGLDLVAHATRNVTCEVTPHHLFLSAVDERKLGPFGMMNPPLRSQFDVRRLWSCLNYVDLIASDHAPHSVADKLMPDPPPGVPGVQTLFPLLLSRLDEIGLARLVNLVCAAPAARFNLKSKGVIAEGFDADLVLVDLEDKRPITPSEMLSKCGWTPFEGCEGIFPSLTMVRGEAVFNEGSIAAKKGWGNQIYGTGGCGHE